MMRDIYLRKLVNLVFDVIHDRDIKLPEVKKILAEFSSYLQTVLDNIYAHTNDKDAKANLPVIVCLCGSTRFYVDFDEANFRETLEGKIVLSIGCNTKSDNNLFKDMTPTELEQVKVKLDELHKRKIELADEILVINVNGYVGQSTSLEILYAMKLHKRIRWLEPEYQLDKKAILKGVKHNA